MSRDYKHRLQQVERQSQRPAVAGWQWLLAGGLVVGFVVFLMSLRGNAPQEPPPAPPPVATHPQPKAPAPAEARRSVPPTVAVALPQVPKEAPTATKEEPLKHPDSKAGGVEKIKPPKPRFQFYTVLPEKEVIIPESEVKAKKQEEKQGKAPSLGEIYVLQIGSFKTMAEADRLKAQLAMLGVEAKIETAQIGSATWNRVKVGPFASMASADKTRSVLRQNHVDSVVQKSISVVPPAAHP